MARPEPPTWILADVPLSFRHKLAPISGSIEQTDATPLAAAWRELHEGDDAVAAATGAAAPGQGLRVRGRGHRPRSGPSTRSPLRCATARAATPPSASTGSTRRGRGTTHWPWRTRTPSAACRAWPRACAACGSSATWGRRPPAPAPCSARGLDVLRTDYAAGARQLAGRALAVLRDVVAVLEPPPSSSSEPPLLDAWWACVRLVAWHLAKNGRESMGAAITSVLLDALTGGETALGPYWPGGDGPAGSGGGVGEWRAAVLGELDRRLALRAATSAGRGVPVVPDLRPGQLRREARGEGPLGAHPVGELDRLAGVAGLGAARRRLARRPWYLSHGRSARAFRWRALSPAASRPGRRPAGGWAQAPRHRVHRCVGGP